MAVSRVGFCGPASAYAGFAPKEEASGGGAGAQSPRPSRYRGGHRVTHYHPVGLLLAAFWRFFA